MVNGGKAVSNARAAVSVPSSTLPVLPVSSEPDVSPVGVAEEYLSLWQQVEHAKLRQKIKGQKS